VLLGVEPDVNDPEIIEAAVQRRMDQLDKYALSSDRATREQVQRLMNEVAKARVKLVKRAEAGAKKVAPLVASKQPVKPDAVVASAPAAPEPTTQPKPALVSEALNRIWLQRQRLSADGWALIGVAWLGSLVFTAAVAYLLGVPEPVAKTVAAVPTQDVEKSNPTVRDIPEQPPIVENEPAVPPTEPPIEEPRPPIIPVPPAEPDPVEVKPPAEPVLPPVVRSAVTSLDEVMQIDDERERIAAFIKLRDSQPDKNAKIKLALDAIKRFNNVSRVSSWGSFSGGGRRSLFIRASNGNVITDLSPLAGLPVEELGLLNLQNVKDFSFLKGSTIDTLDLSGCTQFSDTRVLSEIEGLEELDLSGTAASDLRPLHLTKLRTLSLENCKQLRSLRGIEKMPNLEELVLKGTSVPAQEIARVEQLMKAGQLSTAFADEPKPEPIDVMSFDEVMKIKDHDARLAAFIKLRDSMEPNSEQQAKLITDALNAFNGIDNADYYLRKREDGSVSMVVVGIGDGRYKQTNTTLKDISPLKGMSAGTLSLNNNQGIKDFSVLASMWVEKLSIKDCVGFEDPSILGKIKGLSSVWMSGTGVTSLRGINMKELGFLYIGSCPNLTSLEGLEGMTLRSLFAYSNDKLEDISAVGQIEGLRVVNFQDSAVKDLSALSGLELQELNLRGCTKVDDLSPLHEMRTLGRLNITDATGLTSAVLSALKKARPGTFVIE
jgi:Leucine-rich repeat (LRR) protein